MWRSNPARVVGIAVLALLAGLALLLGLPRGQPAATPPPRVSPTYAAGSEAPSPHVPTPVPTSVATPSVDLAVQLPFEWSSLTLPALPAPWAYGATSDSDGSAEGYVEVLRDGRLVGAFQMRVFLPTGWGDPESGLRILRERVKNDTAWAEPNLEADPMREIPFANGTAVRFGYRAADTDGVRTSSLVEVWHFDGRAVFWLFASWPPNPELGNPSFFKATDFDAFMPVLEALVARLGLPAALATPVPAPTPYVDPNVPLPVQWDALTLPKLDVPWGLGVDDTDAKGAMTITVRRDGSTVGFVRMQTYMAAAYPAIDLQAGLVAAVRRIAADDLQRVVDDRASGGQGLRVEAEAIRELPAAGGRGIRAAFRDVEIATGRIVGRHVLVYHWDGRALWIFQTDWPPDPDVGRSGFDTLADHQAFDSQLEGLVASLRLPLSLPSPAPVYP